MHARRVKLDPSVDLEKIAQGTPGFVGADLENVINEAALLAGRKRKPAVTIDGQTLAAGFFTADQNNLYPVKFWRFSDGALLNTFEASDQGILALAFQPDGRFIASGGGDDSNAGAVRFFRLSDSAQLGYFPQDPNNLFTYVTSVAYSPDGQLVAYARHDSLIVVARNQFSSRQPPAPAPPPSASKVGDDIVPPPDDGNVGPGEEPPDIH